MDIDSDNLEAGGIMQDLIIWFSIVLVTAGLAGYVAARAWDYMPVRLFLVVAAILLSQRLLNELTDLAPDAASAYWTVMLTIFSLSLLSPMLLLLFSALFVPQWFTGRRPIIWILLPYVVVALLLLADMLLRTGIFVAGLRADGESYQMQRSPVAGLPLLILFGFSWLIHIGVLTVAFIRHPPARLSIGLLIGAVVISTLSGAFSILPGIQPPLITIALAYAVLRGRLLTPTRVGIEQAVRAMDNLMLVFDKDRRITFANPIAERLGLADGAQALLTLDHRQQEYVQLDERRILFNYTPLTDNRGSQLGILALGRDTTELEQQAHELERERARLAETVQQLRAEQFERAQLADTVRGLEFPVIPALPGVIILPLVGTLDDARTDEFIGVLLKSIERERADLVLLDITGVPLLDTQGAQTLLNGVRSARLLGARCILAGVRPEIAQALVTLGVNLSEMGTSATLQQALQREIAASGKRRNHA